MRRPTLRVGGGDLLHAVQRATYQRAFGQGDEEEDEIQLLVDDDEVGVTAPPPQPETLTAAFDNGLKMGTVIGGVAALVGLVWYDRNRRPR